MPPWNLSGPLRSSLEPASLAPCTHSSASVDFLCLSWQCGQPRGGVDVECTACDDQRVRCGLSTGSSTATISRREVLSVKRPITTVSCFPLLVAVLIAASLLIVGCDAIGTKPLPPVGLDSVRVEPRPVVVGDTATFTAVLQQDALNSVSQLEFRWFNANKNRQFNTKDNEFHWPAPLDTGTVEFIITARVDDEAEDYTRAKTTTKRFEVDVVESKQ